MRQNLFYESASLFPDFVIPALEQEIYGDCQPWVPGLGVFILERYSCTDQNCWKASPLKVLVIPALEQETYEDFPPWVPGLGLFTLEILSNTKGFSRVSIECSESLSEPSKQNSAIENSCPSNYKMKYENSPLQVIMNRKMISHFLPCQDLRTFLFEDFFQWIIVSFICCLYSESLSEKRWAVDQISVWNTRCHPALPTAVESTVQLVRAVVHDTLYAADKTFCQVEDIKMLYSTAIVRFVNLTLEHNQKGPSKLRMSFLANKSWNIN